MNISCSKFAHEEAAKQSFYQDFFYKNIASRWIIDKVVHKVALEILNL